MIAPLSDCQHEKTHKHGRTRAGQQRRKCVACGLTFTDDVPKPLGDMRIDIGRACTILNLLLEGMSIRSTERITGTHRDTICNLLLVTGEKLDRYHDQYVVDVPVQDVEIDELWQFCAKKEKRVLKSEKGSGVGDAWTFTALARHSKLLLAYHVGGRNAIATSRFLTKVRRAVDDTQRYQVTTDGFGAYQYGVPFALGSRIDFAQLVKSYASTQSVTRYSPAQIIRCEKVPRMGSPAPSRVCTSHVERMNLTIRMHLRRFTRLTNAFSKSLDHHIAMQQVFFTWYNWCRKHQTIKTTPAVEAGLTEKPLTIQQLLEAAA